jgi:hypothetical protein
MPWVPPCSLTAHPVAARRLRAGELIRQSARSAPKGLAISGVRVGRESQAAIVRTHWFGWCGSRAAREKRTHVAEVLQTVPGYVRCFRFLG